jgi:hypothetical protein
MYLISAIPEKITSSIPKGQESEDFIKNKFKQKDSRYSCATPYPKSLDEMDTWELYELSRVINIMANKRRRLLKHVKSKVLEIY